MITRGGGDVTTLGLGQLNTEKVFAEKRDRASEGSEGDWW